MKRALCLAVILGLGVAVTFGGCGGDSPSPTFDNPFDPRNGQGIPIPDSLVVTVGNNAVRVCWGLPEDETADEFALFRQRLDIVEGEVLVKRLTERCYLDTGVRNGRTYAYRIAAGLEGRFGARSEPIEARPGVFSIVINDDAPKTRSRTVTVALTAPAAEAVRLVEDPDSAATAPWRRPATGLSYTLSLGDGPKELFGIIRLPDGSESIPVSDTIVLDTQAFIASVDFDGAEIRHPGETLHFRLDAGETGGTASVTVTGLISALPLFDDGNAGDPVADDGIYERNWEIPAGSATISSAAVTGQFTDDVGNVAAPLTGPRTLTLKNVPEPVTLLDPATLAEPPAAPAVTLRWTQSQATDFSAYQVFRSESAPVDSTSRIVWTVSSRTILQFTDNDVVESRDYFYRVYVLTTSGLQRGSNTLQVPVPNERPPSQVTLEQASSVGETSLSLRWSQSADRDFGAYLVCRNETGTVSLADSLKRITDINQNHWQEQGLMPSTTYHYAVYVQDEGGLWSPPSNEINATTDSEAVTLVSATVAVPPDPPGVTLRWTQASAGDFSAYQIFRSESAPVDSTARLVGTVTARNKPEFNDLGVCEGREVCYRVYVLTTSGSQRGSKNTLCAFIPNERPPQEVTLEPASGVGATSLSLRWSRSTDCDFAAYFVYRNETGTVTDADSLVASIMNGNQSYWDEFGLVDSTTYHYRVYVEDEGGLRSRSNEISVTTGTEPTSAALLLEATDVSGMAATLRWGESTDPRFRLYRLYRDEARLVTTASTLVAEFGGRHTTSFSDPEINPGKVYYYRIYVVDQDDALPKGSNTIEIKVPQ